MTSVLGAEADVAVPKPTGSQSMVERITLIMEAFGQPRTVRTLEQVARSSGLPRSTTYRILEQLSALHWVERVGAGFRLGSRALGLGGHELDHGALRAVAAPVLHDLSLRTDRVVHLAVLDGTEVLYLDKVGGRVANTVPSRVGGRAPAHCTALGKAMLARLDPEQIDGRYAQGVTARTPHSIGDLDRLHGELGRIRVDGGVAFDRGECVDRIACVGVALRGPGGVAGAISVVGESPSMLKRLVPLVIRAAGVIGEGLLDRRRAAAAR
ncbi:IclR family transcriptional regulator [Nocardia sp. NPDC003482]|uniref:IclR family transcriptional regulator n=1 Tax=Nocardia sp. NPDC004068 TaxID=3364303 RepID=UPI0036CA805F